MSDKKRVPTENVFYDAKILITRKCNLNCAFCKIRRDEKLKTELSLSQWEKAFENLKEVGVETIQILGGEPTTREDITEIIKLLNDYGFFYSIESNSHFNDEMFKKLIDAGIKGYSTDVSWSHTPPEKDWFVSKTTEGQKMLAKMKDAGVPYLETNVIITRRNLEELPLTVKKLSDDGVWCNLIPVHYGSEYKWELRSCDVPDDFKIRKEDSEMVRSALEKIIDMKKEGYLILNSVGYFEDLIKVNCSPIGWHCDAFPRLRIDSDGSLWVCNDVRGKTADKYNVLHLSLETLEKFKQDWKLDEMRLNCPGCSWPISKRVF